MNKPIRRNVSAESFSDEDLVRTWNEAVAIAATLARGWANGLYALLAVAAYFVLTKQLDYAFIASLLALFCFKRWLKHTIDESNANYTLHSLEINIRREEIKEEITR